MEDSIKTLMSDVLGIPAETIVDDTSMQNIDTWDSLRHMELVMAIEEKLGMEFEATELMELVSYGDIKRVLKMKGVQV